MAGERDLDLKAAAGPPPRPGQPPNPPSKTISAPTSPMKEKKATFFGKVKYLFLLTVDSNPRQDGKLYIALILLLEWHCQRLLLQEKLMAHYAPQKISKEKRKTLYVCMYIKLKFC
jgi:hypothetical protein